jgi:2-methylaconitate cis-trans-isomerase PrpF
MRGGTSRAIIFHERDLPTDARRAMRCSRPRWAARIPASASSTAWEAGISSLSKVAIVGPPRAPMRTSTTLFGQVMLDAPAVSYKGNCGNISSAIGPFAVDEGLVAASGAEATVRIHNTNTGKIIVARFALSAGKAAVDGDFVLQGVAGTGAPIRLSFLAPGGATTGKLLPTAQPARHAGGSRPGPRRGIAGGLRQPGGLRGCTLARPRGNEKPTELEAPPPRLSPSWSTAHRRRRADGSGGKRGRGAHQGAQHPQVAILSAPREDGTHITVRMMSTGQPHRATPLTGAMCTATAMRLPGTLAAAIARLPDDPGADLVIAHPTGRLPVAARVVDGKVEETVVYRTARRLMEGFVLVPSSRLTAAA